MEKISDRLWWGKRVWLRLRGWDGDPDTYLQVAGLSIRMKLEQSWKGNLGGHLELLTGRGGGDCGFDFEKGESYLLYLSRLKDGSLMTGICHRTAHLSHAEADLAYLAGAFEAK